MKKKPHTKYRGIAVVVKNIQGKSVHFGVGARAHKHEIVAALRNILFLMSE
jgi:ribosomal protein L21E